MIRLANINDKNAVNNIRKQVHLLHAAARPDIFKQEFCGELADRFDYYLQENEYSVAVYCIDDKIVGFVVLKRVCQTANPYNIERNFLLVEELGVDCEYRRRGIGAGLIEYAKDYAIERGFSRIQLDMWAFNVSAEKFYLSQGFDTYRKYMEIKL